MLYPPVHLFLASLSHLLLPLLLLLLHLLLLLLFPPVPYIHTYTHSFPVHLYYYLFIPFFISLIYNTHRPSFTYVLLLPFTYSSHTKMKGTFTTPALFLLSLLVLILTPTTVHAGSYTLTTPTSATRWTAGQPGAITLLSTDKAGASTKPTDRLLTITLRFGKGGFFGKSTQVAVIRDGIQLLVPFKGAENQVKLEVTDWMVPAGTAAGDKYFVQMVRSKDGFLDIFPDKVESAFFQIVATPVAPPPAIPPPANTTGPTPPTPTLNTTTIPLPTPTPTTPLPTTPTLPPGQTCADIQAQCAARNLTFIDTNSTAICQCGPLLIMPVIIGSGASAVGGSLMMAVVGLGLSVLMNSNLLLL